MERNGYTLTELMVVIVLAVTALSIAGPPMFSAHRRSVGQNTVTEFRAIQATARQLARQYGRVTELHMNPARNEYWIAADTTSAGLPRNRALPRMYGRALPSGYYTTDRTLLCYDGRGLPTTEGACEPPSATVVFVLPQRTDTVKISPLGAVLR